MRVAFVGKGGSGKSAIAGTTARLLARRGHAVLALDVDHVPGLAYSLGLAVDDAPPIPAEAIVARPPEEENGGGPRGLPFRLRPGLSWVEAVERYAACGPDGIRFLQFGNVDGGDLSAMAPCLWAFVQIVNEVDDGPWSVVGDLPAGTMMAFAGLARCARTVVVVVEPTAKSLLTGRRLGRLAATDRGPARMVAVANKVRGPDDAAMVRAATGLEVVAAIPWDPGLAEAERHGRAPVDHAPGGPAVRAVEQMTERLIEEGSR
ncbi:MAG: hypothetical protein LC792_16820 [Actinobacteria bacterium]|nr:hypothetical protein [Actinomycetota bacterium]